MKRKSLDTLGCPIGRSLEQVGEWWSILVLRSAFLGAKRFDDFQRSLEIAPNILTQRLKSLVEHGLLERRPYQDKPVRYEYVLTEKGEDFLPILIAFVEWGNRWLAPEGESLQAVDRQTGERLAPTLIDAKTGAEITRQNIRVAPGPAASSALKAWLSGHRT